MASHEANVSDYWPLLSKTEQQRATKFAFPELTRRFVMARGILRTKLSAEIGVRPESIEFVQAGHGKPRLAPGLPAIEFNLSHSGANLVIAIGPCSVGVDVEEIRPMDGLEDLARSVTNEAEFAAWRAGPLEGRLESFYRLWTRKEACAKESGLGLSLDPRLIDTSAGPGIVTSGSLLWHTRELALAGGCVASVAVRQNHFEVIEWR